MSSALQNNTGRRGLLVAAVGLSLLWTLIALMLSQLLPSGAEASRALRALAVGILVAGPLLVVWALAALASAVRIARSAAADGAHQGPSPDTYAALTATLRGLEQTVADLTQSLERCELEIAQLKDAAPLEEDVSLDEEIDSYLSATAVPEIPQTPADAVVEEQPRLALDTSPDDDARLSLDDLVRALNFPNDADDAAGFAAMRNALRHHEPAQLVQASQDMLTLLSEVGVYTDDLTHEPGPPELWRRFAAGDRGPELGALGDASNEDQLQTVLNRLRDDPVFRDASHHFLRRFDLVLERYAPEMSDAQLLRLADTRTARAFVLLARGAGVFA